MHSSNCWINHVKQYATKNKISYNDAMIKAKPSYIKLKKTKVKAGKKK